MMIRISYPVSALCAWALLATTALADHGKYRRLDEFAFAATADARELRWEVHDGFTVSRDYRLLLRDAEIIADQVRQVTGVIWAESPDPLICRQVEQARNAITDLSRRLDHCDLSAPYWRNTPLPGPCLPPSSPQQDDFGMDTARLLMARIDASLCAIHNELTGGQLVPYQFRPQFAPTSPPATLPAPQSPNDLPPLSQWHPGSMNGPHREAGSRSTPTPHPGRTNSSRSPTVELPLFGERGGRIVLRIRD